MIGDALRGGYGRELELGPGSLEADATFFDLGGTSVSLVALLPRFQSVLGPGVTVLDVFAHPTPRALAHAFAVPRVERGGQTVTMLEDDILAEA